MKYEADLMDARRSAAAEGRAEGKVEGEASAYDKLGRLAAALTEAGRSDELVAAMQDSAVREKLLQEFGIE